MSLVELYFRGAHVNSNVVREVPSPQRRQGANYHHLPATGSYNSSSAAPSHSLVPKPPLSSISSSTARPHGHGRMLPLAVSSVPHHPALPPVSPRRQAPRSQEVATADARVNPNSGGGGAAEAAARRRREAELLEAMRFRRERYEAAVRSAHGILERISLATEFVPKEEGLKLRPPPATLSSTKSTIHTESMNGAPPGKYYASVDQMPSYHLKQNGHELTVLTEPSMEDPFLLDDVDADEQQGLSEMVKRVEDAKKRKAARLARKQKQEEQQQHHLTGQDQAAQLPLMEKGAGLPTPDDAAALRTTPSPRSRTMSSSNEQLATEAVEDNALGGEEVHGDDDGDDADVVQVHPSEVARKRRIMRKVWMGGIIHLRDLYASKDGSLHATTADGTVDTGRQAVSASMMSSSAFVDSGAGDDEAEFFDYGDATDEPQSISARSRRFGGDDDDAATPVVPPFSSRSLAWICESVGRDMAFVTASTETMLRTAMSNSGVRRAGALDYELARCRHCVRKTLAWTSGAETHARMFASGEHMVSEGVSMEVAAQRRVLLRSHEELSEVQKAADDADDALEQLRQQVEELRQDKLILTIALREGTDLFLGDTTSPTLRGNPGTATGGVVADDAVTREIMARLRLRLRNASAEVSVARSGRRRLTNAHGSPVSINRELSETDEAMQRIAEAMVQKGDGRFRFETLSKGASRTMLLRRRQSERSLLPG